MYHEFYQLRDLPFENTPHPRFFFSSEKHSEALAAIEYTIRMRKGIVLVTGPIGSGKTTVGRTMCERCRQQAAIIEIAPGHTDRGTLLRQILRTLRLPLPINDDISIVLQRLQGYLLQQAAINHPVVLFVDEAQTLGDRALEELRLLSNFDTPTAKSIQIVLVGQPELRHRICRQPHDALRQRIVMARQLAPLSRIETSQYVAHRLAAASLDRSNVAVTFAPPALDRIYTACGGVPRLINATCDNCLLLGYVRESNQITAQMVDRVLEDMVPRFEDHTASIPAQVTLKEAA